MNIRDAAARTATENGPTGGSTDRGDSESIPLAPALLAELLDPESWGRLLGLYARTMKLAIALQDADGELVGECHNPQPIWSRARERKPDWPGRGCLFCLERTAHCTAAAEARRTNSLVLTHDPAGFAHVALPLSVGGRRVGTLLAGQVVDRHAEMLPLHRMAREFDLPPQDVWHLARQQAPISRANLTIYGELLGMVSQAFLRDRYSSMLEARSTEQIKGLNQQLATVNAALHQKVAELNLSNKHLQHVLDSTETREIFLDHELRIEKLTPSAAKWFRVDDGVIGRPMEILREHFAEVGLAEQAMDHLELAGGGLVERISEIVREFSPGAGKGRRVMRELNLTAANGQHYLLRVISYPAEESTISGGAVVTFVDVTTLKNAEQLLASEKRFAETIVATIAEPLLVLDGAFHVQLVNEAFRKTFETRTNETEGRLLYDLGNGEWDIPELRRLLTDLLARKQWVEDFEVERDFVKLGRRTMLINARRLADRDQILLGIRDITERKRSENALRKLSQDLKHFSYAAAHDLQEPLRTVSICAQLLEQKYKGKLGEEGDEFLDSVVEGAQRTVTLLKELREYWLVTEGGGQLVPIDCEAVFKKIIRALRVAMKDSGAVVTHQALPTVWAEEVSLAMLLQNLLGNAIKYRRGGAPPRIDLGVEKAAGAWRFSVRDNGIGIKPEDLEKIFLPFKRLNARDSPGTGIGLALCDKIVERYGGRIWAESVFGQGSTFYFTIPERATAIQ